MRDGRRNRGSRPRAPLTAGAGVHPAAVTTPRRCGILSRMGKWALLQTEGSGKGRIVALEKDARTIGRGAEAQIQITDALASRRHARLLAGEHGCLQTDEGSANGTCVHGERIEERLLTLGEAFSIGQCSFHLFRPEELLAPGRLIGAWEIGELLDVDAVSWRYRARQKILEREVELEVIRDSLTADEELLELLRSLLRRIAAASDPRIVPVFDLVEIEDRLLVARRFTSHAPLVWEGLTLKERGERIGDDELRQRHVGAGASDQRPGRTRGSSSIVRMTTRPQPTACQSMGGEALAAQVEAALGALFPKKHWIRVSDTFILHGRRICKPTPQCQMCFARSLCDYAHR